MSLKSRVEAAIKSVKISGSGQDLLGAGMIQSVTAGDGEVIVLLQVDGEDAAQLEPTRKSLEEKLLKVRGVKSAKVVMTAERSGSAPAAAQNSSGLDLQSHTPKPGAKAPAASGRAKPPTPQPLKGVKHLIAVASGKGGVGKSTTSVNLAFALKKLGYKVGLVDCDIYGPSASLLLGQDTKPAFDENDQIVPLDSHGILSISMSNIIPPDTAAVWRGPMVIKSVQQFLMGVKWDMNGPLDILVADLPPGTGDVQLTLAQTANIHGAVIVSTPQDLALIDARKAFDMFEKTNTPVLGLIENMSYFLCPHCGERSDIFSHGGAKSTAETKKIDFLGEIPLDMQIREAADSGQPILLSDPDSPIARTYMDIAEKLSATLDSGQS